MIKIPIKSHLTVSNQWMKVNAIYTLFKLNMRPLTCYLSIIPLQMFHISPIPKSKGGRGYNISLISIARSKDGQYVRSSNKPCNIHPISALKNQNSRLQTFKHPLHKKDGHAYFLESTSKCMERHVHQNILYSA